MNEVTLFTLEDGNYFVLDKIEYEGKIYLYLFNEDDPEKVIIQEYEKESDILKGVPKEIFDTVLTLFDNRHAK